MAPKHHLTLSHHKYGGGGCSVSVTHTKDYVLQFCTRTQNSSHGKALKQCKNFIIAMRLFAILSLLLQLLLKLGARVFRVLSFSFLFLMLPISLVLHISGKTDIIMFILRNWNSVLCHLMRFLISAAKHFALCEIRTRRNAALTTRIWGFWQCFGTEVKRKSAYNSLSLFHPQSHLIELYPWKVIECVIVLFIWHTVAIKSAAVEWLKCNVGK